MVMKMFNSLVEHIENDGGASLREFFDKMKRQRIRRKEWGAKLVPFIDAILVWEEAYEEKLYKKGIQGYSNILSAILAYAEEIGEEIDDCCFMHTVSIYVSPEGNEYKFLLIQGQGSILKVYKNEIQIFQST